MPQSFIFPLDFEIVFFLVFLFIIILLGDGILSNDIGVLKNIRG